MTKTPISTYILIGINLIAFGWLALQQQSLMMDSNFDVLAILDAGANLNPFTLGGQPWRIITSMFLHFGIIHLLVNMYGLYYLGTSLEPAVGTIRFLLVYFFCGIAAGLASLVFNIYTPSAGASGALFGLFGYRLGAEVIGSFHHRKNLMVVFVNFIVFVLINVFIAATVNVDIAGHIGGFMAGLLLATFHFRLRWFIQKKVLALLLVLLASTLFVLPKDQLRYYQIFQRVLNLERHTNDLYNTIKTNGTLKDSLAVLLPEWDSISFSLNSINRIPFQLSADTAILRDYIQLRRQETFYRIKQIERESYVYYDSLEILNAKFRALPELKYVLNYKIIETQEELLDTLASNNSMLTPVQVYYDQHWKETDDILSAKFYRVGKKDSVGRWHGTVVDYFKDGEIQMKGKYQNDMKEGIFIYYSDHRTYESAGRYEKEQAVGKWENFHWNGALKSEVFYNGESFTSNVFDSLGNAQVVNGNGKYKHWFGNGKLAEEGDYRNGKKEGLWYGYYPDGKPYFKEQFRSNRLVHGVSIGKDGRRFVYDQLSEFPFPVKGMPAYKQYIEKNKRMPFSKPAAGKVKLVFTVGIDGSTWNYVVIQSVSPACDREAIRLVREGPSWRAALLHGQEKVTGQGYIEIEF
jgi:membrane associated rhomboid family serine protease/antitoxin component YwqK of YwqJK toxin-antitoxin module